MTPTPAPKVPVRQRLRNMWFQLSDHDWEQAGYWMLTLLAMLFMFMMMLSGCSTTVLYKCPPLAPPTPLVVTSLETAGRQDPSSGAWVIGLEKHYEKCDALQKLHK